MAMAPNQFDFADGRARPTSERVDGQDGINLVLAAADLCPAAAISVAGPTFSLPD